MQRGIGAIYLVAFVVAARRFVPLLGERGLLPVPETNRRRGFRAAPSIFSVHYSDRFFMAIASLGMLLAAAVVAGLPERDSLWMSMLVWSVLWVLYLSIVNVGQTFYSFGWESLLLEAGFLAIFLGSSHTAPPVLVLWLFRWLVFRVEFGAGMIKLRGDPCWRDLTCLYYHHETQPLPNPLSWYFHHLPKGVHKVEVAANHFAQLVVPFLLFAPQPIASIAGAVIVVTQLWLVLSGNFSWLNVLTVAIAVSALDDAALRHVIPVARPATLATGSRWFHSIVVAVAVLFAVLSYWPTRNLFSRRQRMNYTFNRLHLANTYGAFGHITRERREVIIEGTDDIDDEPTTVWKEYEFKAKPGDPRRRPPQVAPYHLRLDWLMWFAALSPAYARTWFVALVAKLLDNDQATLKLLRANPFPDQPPARIRARLYRYRFTSRDERRESGAWWIRHLVGEYLPPVARRSATHEGRQ
jgi:hypothetical protein